MARFFFALCLVLIAAAPAASAQRFNAQEQAEIRAIVREYLVNNPDVLREALDALEERAGAERWTAVKTDPRDFAIGPANAPVTIVEFYDYRCTYCHAALEWVTDLTRTRRDIRFVFKELPILSDASFAAARAALAARPQGRYMQFHRALMSHPLNQEMTPADIDRIARTAGIDVARMRREMDSPEITAHLEQNRAQAINYNITGTPGFVINGELISGFDRERLEARIREATRAARARQASR